MLVTTRFTQCLNSLMTVKNKLSMHCQNVTSVTKNQINMSVKFGAVFKK